jgi:hypothetical protein
MGIFNAGSVPLVSKIKDGFGLRLSTATVYGNFVTSPYAHSTLFRGCKRCSDVQKGIDLIFKAENVQEVVIHMVVVMTVLPCGDKKVLVHVYATGTIFFFITCTEKTELRADSEAEFVKNCAGRSMRAWSVFAEVGVCVLKEWVCVGRQWGHAGEGGRGLNGEWSSENGLMRGGVCVCVNCGCVYWGYAVCGCVQPSSGGSGTPTPSCSHTRSMVPESGCP